MIGQLETVRKAGMFIGQRRQPRMKCSGVRSLSSECYLLYDVIEETKESSVKIIIAKYAYHWYNKL